MCKYALRHLRKGKHMKLKDNFLTQVIDDTQVMVAAGDSDFNGIIRKYEGADEQITSDVDMVIATLRRVGAIEE